ncbi:polyketide synthase regulator [Microbacterium mangrovi]|uniref:Polyketide synthase regulator n=1 Tax=Microbacterium mangrovi TaxID=1348253 RepID=A0A0B2A6P0_9MICO|nr:helix-turn-helix domain-containing protein [Microbacterium mangrovi]KHK99199.1 polyketide synthase regulator [Microbacterium mangrovi]
MSPRPGAGLQLSALLAHAANGGLRPVAGPAEAVFDDVSVEAGEPDLAADGTRMLAVLTTAPPVESWQRDALLRRVRDRGFAALALPGAAELDAGTRRLADRLGLALLHVARPIELARACWMLLEARDALTLGQVRKVAGSFEYSAADLGDLLAHLAANLGYGVALVDAAGTVQEAGDHLDPDLHAAIDFGPWIDIARTERSAAASVRVDSPTRAGLRLAIFGDGLGEAQLHSLAVTAEIAMPAVAARILIDEVAAVNDVAVSSALLRDFMDLRGTPDTEVERRMLERGWRTAGYHLGFRIVGRSRIDPFPLVRTVAGELGSIDAETHVTTAGRGVTGWLTFPVPPDARQLAGYVEALRELHLQTRRSFNIATGVGSLRSGADGLGRTLAEAADAARLAGSRSRTTWFLPIEGLGAEQLLLSWTESDTFVPAASALLAPLMARGPELLQTLTAYLDHESAIAATADALSLHRNTVSTRIQRAQELLGLDLDDPDTRLAVHLACRALKA